MHRVKKGNQWHFGMKAHIGVDAESGLVQTVTHPLVLFCARVQSSALRCVLVVFGRQVSISEVKPSTSSIALISISSTGLIWRFFKA